MIILGVDPGNVKSAIVYFDTEKEEILEKQILENNECLAFFRNKSIVPDLCLIEQIASMGMAVGESVFETCVWSGRFMECFSMLGWSVDRIKRMQIKNILCGSSRAKDANIRQRLIDLYGAPGVKKQQGKTYGLKADMWAAFAVCVAWKLNQCNK